MTRAFPCRRPRADVVSFDTNKTNSSNHFFYPRDGSMLLNMEPEFLGHL